MQLIERAGGVEAEKNSCHCPMLDQYCWWCVLLWGIDPVGSHYKAVYSDLGHGDKSAGGSNRGTPVCFRFGKSIRGGRIVKVIKGTYWWVGLV